MISILWGYCTISVSFYYDQNVIHVLCEFECEINLITSTYCKYPFNLHIFFYYRTAVANNGMWDQLRVDHGREFYLTLYMQEKLSQHRHNTNRLPYVQTTSSKVNFDLQVIYKDNNQLSQLTKNVFTVKNIFIIPNQKKLAKQKKNAFKN